MNTQRPTLTDADKETINRVTIGGLQELLSAHPELLTIGVDRIGVIYHAGVRSGVDAAAQVLAGAREES